MRFLLSTALVALGNALEMARVPGETIPRIHLRARENVLFSPLLACNNSGLNDNQTRALEGNGVCNMEANCLDYHWVRTFSQE